MEKRYQIFVSSTYVDLREERQQVLQALLEMDCIPAGMELFPAADEEQFEFIKRVIDDCDYYLLIIGGKYGSMTTDGISYTELEYNYAIEKGLKVVALLHGNPGSLPETKIEIDGVARERLTQFRDKVTEGRLVKFWERIDQLPGLVALSLQKTIKMYPAAGWIRGNENNPNEITDLLMQLNELRRTNEILLRENQNINRDTTVQSIRLASGEEPFMVCVVANAAKFPPDGKGWESLLTWNQILSVLGPKLFQHMDEDSVNTLLAKWLVNSTGNDWFRNSNAKVEEECFETIRMQLLALGFIDVQSLRTVSGPHLFWTLTSHGKTALMRIRAVATTISDGAHT